MTRRVWLVLTLLAFAVWVVFIVASRTRDETCDATRTQHADGSVASSLWVPATAPGVEAVRYC